jgi:hypothetical protein
VQRLQVLITETIIISHGQKNKRNRRLSSIVGVNTNPYGRDYEVEELIESKYGHHKAGYDNAQDSARKYSASGNYFNYNSGQLNSDKSINQNPFYRSGME